MNAELAAIAKQSNVSISRVLEEWNERAAIRQYEGGLPRGGAESCAVDDVRMMFAGEMSRAAAATRGDIVKQLVDLELGFSGAHYVPDGENYW